MVIILRVGRGAVATAAHLSVSNVQRMNVTTSARNAEEKSTRSKQLPAYDIIASDQSFFGQETGPHLEYQVSRQLKTESVRLNAFWIEGEYENRIRTRLE